MPKTEVRTSKATRQHKRAGLPRRRGGGKKSQRVIEQALAALAHDIRTPLTGILALAELLAASDLGERERRWAAGVKDAAEHLAQITTIVCDAVRADAVGLALREDEFSPRRLADVLGASLSARAEINNLDATITIADDLPERAVGDPVRLRAALENLIDNAVKFTARGTVTFHASAKSAGKNRARLIFIVTDSGIGLKLDEIRKLFRPFAQASEAVSRRYGGTGLGLVLVKRLARAMGGDLTVTSKPGRGSSFRLDIIVGKAAESSAQWEEQVGSTASSPARRSEEKRNILCVEDNPYGRVVLNTILTELGHRVDFVGTGEAAVTAVSRGHYDLVLMDVTLTGMDGLETTRRIRALTSPVAHIPIIGISGHTGADTEARVRAAGMDDFLAKPVSPRALAGAMTKYPPH